MKYTSPRSLSGTMELLPDEQILFNNIKDTIREVYESYGFLPLDTPVIERADVLLAKAGGETEKQIYKFSKGDTDICMRFDLTVPLAKYVAQNINNLEFPFKRYQIGKSYRGERPQRGRYREFYQCDIDIIGRDTLSIKNDAELPVVIYDIFSRLNFGDFTININNRKIINGLFDAFNVGDKKEDAMRTIDKFDKIGEENVKAVLIDDLGLTKSVAEQLIKFVTFKGSNNQVLDMMKNCGISNETFLAGLNELEEVINCIRAQGVPEKYFQIRLSIVRGLDYYTGTVFETTLDDYPEIGSVCGGGRYDNLAGFYTDQKLPGVGVSIGLTRLFYQLKESGLIKSEKHSIADVLVLPMDESAIQKSYAVASVLRKNGVNCQTYLEGKKFKNKLNYADKLKIPFIIIIGENEVKDGTVALKDMFGFNQIIVKDGDLIKTVKEKLNK